MALGGWSSWDTVKSHYLAGSLVATPAMVDFYGWLARPAVAVEAPPLASFVPACRHLPSLRPCLLSLLAVSASVGNVDVVALLLWAPLCCFVFLCCFFFPNFLFGGV